MAITWAGISNPKPNINADVTATNTALNTLNVANVSAQVLVDQYAYLTQTVLNISNDNLISGGTEKTLVRQFWDSVISSHNYIKLHLLTIPNFNSINVALSNYELAIEDLGNILNNTTNVWTLGSVLPIEIADNKLTVTSNIIGSAYRLAYANYYSKYNNLLIKLNSNAEYIHGELGTTVLSKVNSSNALVTALKSNTILSIGLEKDLLRKLWEELSAKQDEVLLRVQSMIGIAGDITTATYLVDPVDLTNLESLYITISSTLHGSTWNRSLGIPLYITNPEISKEHLGINKSTFRDNVTNYNKLYYKILTITTNNTEYLHGIKGTVILDKIGISYSNIVDILNDNYLTLVERKALRDLWDSNIPNITKTYQEILALLNSLANPSTEYSNCSVIEQALLNTYTLLGNYLNQTTAPTWDLVTTPSIISDIALSATSSLTPLQFVVSTAKQLYTNFISAHVDALNYLSNFSKYINGVDGNTILSNMSNANSYIAGIGNDNIITAGIEKRYARIMWDSLTESTVSLVNRALAISIAIPYTIQSILEPLGQQFHNAPLWLFTAKPIPYHLTDALLSTDMPIDGVLYRQNLKTTYATLANLNVIIADNASTLKGVDGTLLLQQITNGYEYALHLADDNLVTQSERKDLRKSWDILVNTYAVYEIEVTDLIKSNGSALPLLTTKFNNLTGSLQLLGNFLNKGVTWDRVSIPAYIDALSLADTRTFVVDPVNVTSYRNLLTNVYNDIKLLDQSIIRSNIAVSTSAKYVSDLTSDGKITKDEIIKIKQDWEELIREANVLTTSASSFITTAVTNTQNSYITAFNALSTYLNAGTVWSFAVDYIKTPPNNLPLYIRNVATFTTITLALDTNGNPNTLDKFRILISNTLIARENYKIAIENSIAVSKGLHDASTSYVDKLTNDGILSSIEKKQVRGDWIALVDEGAKLIQQATDLGITTESTNYVASFETMSTVLNSGTSWTISNVSTVPWSFPALIMSANLTTDTPLSNQDTITSFANAVEDVMKKRELLKLAITAKEKTQATKLSGIATGADVTRNNTALNTNNVNGIPATTVLNNITVAKDYTDAIASDGIFSPIEKKQLRNDWIALIDEGNKLSQKVADLGVASSILTNYIISFETLSTSLNNGVTWTISNLSTTPVVYPALISGTLLYTKTILPTGNAVSIFITQLTDVFNKRSLLKLAIATAEKTLTDNLSNIATTAKTYTDGLAGDGVLSQIDKRQLRGDWESLIDEGSKLSAQWTDLGITTTELATYITSFEALSVMLNSGVAWTITNVATVPWSYPSLINDTNILTVTTLPTGGSVKAFSVQLTDVLVKREAVKKVIQTKLGAETTKLSGISTGADVTGSNTSLDTSNVNGRASTTITKESRDGYNYTVSLADDGIITPSEKISIRQAWDSIVSIRATIIASATSHSISYTPYDTAFKALATYLHGSTWTSGVPSYINNTNLSKQTLLNGATYRAKLSTYWNEYTKLVDTIAKRATWANVSGTGKPTDNADVTGVNTALNTTNVGTLSSINLVKNLTSAKSYTDNLASDSILTSIEKKQLRGDWIALVDEGAKLIQRFIDLGLRSATPSTDADNVYIASFEVLSSSLNNNTSWTITNVASIPWVLPLFINDTGILTDTSLSTGSVSSFQTHLTDVFNKRQVLKNVINSKEGADTTKLGGIQAQATVGANISNLNIGLSSNLVPNSEFAHASLVGWLVGGTQLPLGINVATYFPTNGNASGLHDIQGYVSGRWSELISPAFPVEGGSRYEHFAMIANHRCSVSVYLYYYDSSGAFIGRNSTPTTDTTTVTNPGGKNLSSWKQLGGFSTASATASYARLVIRKEPTFNDGTSTDSWVFTTNCYVGKALASQTAFSAYSIGGSAGVLSSLDKADWASQVAGTGKPANNADVTSANTSFDTSYVNGVLASTISANVNTANSYVTKLTSDGIISITDKKQLRSDWINLVDEGVVLVQRFVDLGLRSSTPNTDADNVYIASFESFSLLLNNNSAWSVSNVASVPWVLPVFIADANLTTNSSLASGTSISGIVIKLTDVLNKRQALKNAINANDKTATNKLSGIAVGANKTTNTNQLTDGAGLGNTANWVNVASRPTSLLALNSADGNKLSGIQAQANKTYIDALGKLQGLSSGNATPVKNSIISINANGTLTGAGTGQVNLGNLTGKLQAAQVDAGVISAGKITTGTLSANVIGANTIVANMINVATIASLSADLGTVTAGNITGTSNININGYGKFKGAVPGAYGSSAVVCNESFVAGYGVVAYGSAQNYAGVYGIGNNLAVGVAGYSPSHRALQGISDTGYALHTSGTNYLGGNVSISGQLVSVGNTSVVTNLNAHMLDGYHASNAWINSTSYIPVVRNDGTAKVMEIGSHLDMHSPYSSLDYDVRLQADSSQTLVFYSPGGVSNFVIYSNGAVTYRVSASQASDKRLKKEIKPLSNSLSKINKLQGCSFKRIDIEDSKVFDGVIAQEIQEVLPNAVIEDKEGSLSVDYSFITANLIEAVKDLTTQVKQLKQEVKELKCQDK